MTGMARFGGAPNVLPKRSSRTDDARRLTIHMRRLPMLAAFAAVFGLLSIFDFLVVRNIVPQGANDGAAAGWWWCLSVCWLAAGWPESAPQPTRKPLHFRWYVVAVCSGAGLLEVWQQGMAAALGFVVGAAGFAAPLAVVEAAMRLFPNRLRLPGFDLDGASPAL